MSKKIDNTRIVTFQEDYFSKAGLNEIALNEAKNKENKTNRPHMIEPIYKKGSVHAIHQVTVAQLKEKGAKMEVKKFDYQRAVQLAKQAMEN